MRMKEKRVPNSLVELRVLLYLRPSHRNDSHSPHGSGPDRCRFAADRSRVYCSQTAGDHCHRTSWCWWV